MNERAKPKRTRRKRTFKAVKGEILDERNGIDWNNVDVTFDENGKPIFHNRGKRNRP